MQCSYVDLVAPAGTRAQTPNWFVSHWWGEPVLDFIACVEQHAKVRALKPEDAVYWVCAYANNQHKLDSDITADPKDSAFAKAMQMCEGSNLRRPCIGSARTPTISISSTR